MLYFKQPQKLVSTQHAFIFLVYIYIYIYIYIHIYIYIYIINIMRGKKDATTFPEKPVS